MANSTKRILLGTALGVALLILPPFVVPFFYPWSEINFRHQDINIKTGQRRDIQKIWFVTVSERVSDTPISVLLSGKTVDAAPVEAWHRVNTFAPWIGHSPN